MARLIEVGLGVVIDSERVLVTQRKPDGPLPGLWEIPGGKVERGETHEVCVRRELMEEVGLEVSVGAIIGVWEHAYPHGAVRLWAYWCRRLSGEARAIEVADLTWADRLSLHERSYPEASLPLISEIASALP
ncbi:(deoxy)nucleoside triphosphate pyrophosphohydrolase [Mucisphaera calidilacus]|uniref:8-oxo-dGTP diphosphatase n=1 Tax=Mucisphaera calidilacus TaxID=2527982 RepID=A0A518BWI3_9BACT|nr:(deoxy)nucleoside triphosphate pyrophosphohydrolase [Mucisphaera calidilacus]QDU71321.1 8-oxo-dGTP diphosphatase [Mucisphaera calidilacus]